MVTRMLFLVNTERKREPAASWCSSEGSYQSHLPCLSSLKAFIQTRFFSWLCIPLEWFISENIRCLLGEILFPICPSEWRRWSSPPPLQSETAFRTDSITHVRGQCWRAQRGEKITQDSLGGPYFGIKDPRSLKVSLGKNIRTYVH